MEYQKQLSSDISHNFITTKQYEPVIRLKMILLKKKMKTRNHLSSETSHNLIKTKQYESVIILQLYHFMEMTLMKQKNESKDKCKGNSEIIHQCKSATETKAERKGERIVPSMQAFVEVDCVLSGNNLFLPSTLLNHFHGLLLQISNTKP